jgi:DNA-binding NarL/FixJ family response regulator
MDCKRILIADDNEEMRATIRRCLEAEFEIVAAVEDGKSLLEAESRLTPDVCLLEISMPGINGIETATRLKAMGSTAKIVFVTIIDDIDYVEAALKIGASGYVRKDRIFSDLRVAINEALAGRTFVSACLRSSRWRHQRRV